MNIESIIRNIAKQFKKAKLYYGHGTNNADDEAFALVCMVLELPFDESIYTREISEEERQKINELVQKRIQTRKPLSYLTQVAYFTGLPFYVDERVLIPRSPFAELIENQFIPWVEPEKIKKVLDLCTGSGCMAISTALVLPQVQVDATDISKDALKVAKINCEKFKVSDRVHLIESDLFQNILNKKYDLIISNPPYVGEQEMKKLPKEYLHEPTYALQTEQKGLEIVLRILKEARNYLTKQGMLMIEVGNHRKILEKRFPDIPFIWPDFERGGDGILIVGT